MAMDKAKMRLFAGATGILFGFAGITTFAAALVVVFAPAIGLALSVTLVACGFMAIAGFAFYFFLLPNKPYDAELDQFEHAGAEALADLPIDTLKTFVSKRPVTSAAIAGLIGYSLLRDPKEAHSKLERLAMRFL